MNGPDELWLDSTDPIDHQGQRGDLMRLLTALRQPPSAEELDGEESIVAAIQAALDQTAAPRVAQRRRLVGRIAVVKGTVAIGALAFGVAAAATTGMVDVPRLPGWPHPPASDAPASPESIGSNVHSDSSEAGDPTGNTDGDTGPATETSETSGSVAAGAPRGEPGAPAASSAAPTSTSTSTTGPTTTVAPSDAEAPGSGKANPPPPLVSLPPPAEQRPHGPPDGTGLPPCAQSPPVADTASDHAAAGQPCPPQP